MVGTYLVALFAASFSALAAWALIRTVGHFDGSSRH